MDDGLACVLRVDHPQIGKSISKKQYEQVKHANMLRPGPLRAGLFQALERQRCDDRSR